MCYPRTWYTDQPKKTVLDDRARPEAAEDLPFTPTDPRFGPACRAVFAEFDLPNTLYDDVVMYFDEVDHTEWYSKLVLDSIIDTTAALRLSQAMHTDNRIQH